MLKCTIYANFIVLLIIISMSNNMSNAIKIEHAFASFYFNCFKYLIANYK